jgi:hypothetical protein
VLIEKYLGTCVALNLNPHGTPERAAGRIGKCIEGKRHVKVAELVICRVGSAHLCV